MSDDYVAGKNISRERSPETSFSGSAKSTINTVNNLAKTSTSIVKDAASAVSSTATLVTQLGSLGLNTYSAFTNTQQYSELVDAAGGAALSYLNSKINRVKDLWNTKVDVTVQSIIGEVAPYALKLEDIGPNLEKKISKMMGYLLGTGTNEGTFKSLANDVGQDVLDALQSDGSLNSSLSNLSAIQAYANTFNVINQAINIIKRLKNIYETIKPGLSISSGLALTVWSGGTSALEASNTIVEEVQKEVSLVEVLILYAIKKLVFPLKVKMPALIVGAVDSISVRSAMLGLSGDMSWLGTLFDDNFFDDLDYTLTVSDSISQALSAVRGAKKSVESNYNLWLQMGNSTKYGDGQNGTLSRGDLMKSLFMKEFTQIYMGNISAEARKTAYLPDYSSLSYFSKSTSADLISKSSTSANTPGNKTIWKYQREDDSEESPIKSIESLRKITRTLYNNL